MKIGITGARGRLGRVLRGHFQAAGDQVSAFSRCADAEHVPLASLPPLLEAGSLDVLLHLAWSTLPATAEQDPGAEWREDFPLLESLLATLAERTSKGDAARLIFFSTGAVYGEPQSDRIFCEGDTRPPKGRYAAGKVAAEEVIERYRSQHSVHACVLRVTNPYGFTQGEECRQGVIPAMLSAARQQEEFTVWGQGDAVKDYVHIDDMCDAVDQSVRRKLEGFFNVASGVSTSLREVPSLIEKSTGEPLELRFAEPRAWDVQHGRYS